ncbi:hypothetical protein DFQ26_008754 [Actinomortierella ambigua]|nr:hypothetical protein DFQ26_008754 [Actinomortierella ambigua]
MDSTASEQTRNSAEPSTTTSAVFQEEVEDDDQQPVLQPGGGQQNMHYVEETAKWTYTDQDGVSFEYDEQLKAWFPMYDEQLIQAQQSAYGETVPDTIDNVFAENKKRQHQDMTGDEAYGNYDEEEKDDDDEDDEVSIHEADLIAMANLPGAGEGSKYNNNNKNKNKRAKNAPKERKPKPVTSVFVTGLPPDADLEEMVDMFKKGGVFMDDDDGQPRIKLYTNDQGQKNGEALVTYLRPESVPLAIDLLDDTEFRPGQKATKMRVQQAVFKEKERTQGGRISEDRKKKTQKKFQKMEKKLGWFDDENKLTAERWRKVCILKHMFTTQEMEADPTLILDLKEDIREECEKLGEVTNVIIYDQHPDGVVSVKFKDVESAELCIRLMNGRFFAGQRIEAELYDGHTKYDVKKSKEEMEAEEKQRLERYAKWLEAEEAKTNKDGEEQVLAADAPTP